MRLTISDEELENSDGGQIFPKTPAYIRLELLRDDAIERSESAELWLAKLLTALDGCKSNTAPGADKITTAMSWNLPEEGKRTTSHV